MITKQPFKPLKNTPNSGRFNFQSGTKPIVSRRSKSKNEMKTIDEIRQALKDMETRRTSAMLDMVEKMPNGIKYDTDIIRRLESIDVTIHALKWVLQPTEANGG